MWVSKCALYAAPLLGISANEAAWMHPQSFKQIQKDSRLLQHKGGGVAACSPCCVNKSRASPSCT
jgi:hypothetical protein